MFLIVLRRTFSFGLLIGEQTIDLPVHLVAV